MNYEKIIKLYFIILYWIITVAVFYNTYLDYQETVYLSSLCYVPQNEINVITHTFNMIILFVWILWTCILIRTKLKKNALDEGWRLCLN